MKFSRNILTTADGVRQDGNVSLNVVNLQFLLSIGGIDHTYMSTNTRDLINGQKGDASVTGNHDTNGTHVFMNLGNVNGGNSNDFSDGAGAAITAKWSYSRTSGEC